MGLAAAADVAEQSTADLWGIWHPSSYTYTHTELYVALVAVNNMWGEKRYRGGENLSKRQSAKAKSFASVQEERETKSRADGA